LDPARFGPSLAECEPAFAEPDEEIPASVAPELPRPVFDHEGLTEPDGEIPASLAPEPPRLVFDHERDASTVRAA
jgi:hypothetical protein